MADKKKATKKKLTATQRWAAKNKKKTTAEDLPGKGQLKRVGRKIEERKKKMRKAMGK